VAPASRTGTQRGAPARVMLPLALLWLLAALLVPALRRGER
jgi:hypothetical protein